MNDLSGQDDRLMTQKSRIRKGTRPESIELGLRPSEKHDTDIERSIPGFFRALVRDLKIFVRRQIVD